MGYSKLCCKRIPAYSGNYTKGRNTKIKKITIHHMGGVLSCESCGAIWKRKGRNGSSHYGIGNDGRIANYVDENDTAWTDSNWNSNCQSVTIETSNSKAGGKWPVSNAALKSLIRLCADIAKRNKLGKLVKGKNLTWHMMYANTDCPGPYLLSKMDYIVSEANKILGGASKEKVDQILHKGSKVKFNGVFKVNEIKKPNRKYKNGAVGCYATCLGKPVGADDWIPCGPLAKCNSKGKNINNNAVLKVGDYWCCTKEFSVVNLEAPSKHAKNGIATLEADGVKFKVDCKVLKEV